MILSVTITGADDAADPNQLAHLSRFYPFVEWAVLFSDKRRGSPRYPSLQWIRRLEDVAAGRAGRMKLAMHLCGAEARLAASEATHFDPGPAWRRVQVNGYEAGAAKREWIPAGSFTGRSAFSWILQARSRESLRAVIDDARVSSADVLYDPSGGEGKRPDAWPSIPAATSLEESAIGFGFAGGIGPDNVAGVLREVTEQNPNLSRVWIDMESGVRTGETLDLDKVKAVLSAVASVRRRLAEHDLGAFERAANAFVGK